MKLMTNRRGFLIGLGASLAAPAIVKADNLMKIIVPRPTIYVPDLLLPPGFLATFQLDNKMLATHVYTGKEWFSAAGQLLSRSAYPELYAAFGTTFGGEGEKFQLPDLRGRSIND